MLKLSIFTVFIFISASYACMRHEESSVATIYKDSKGLHVIRNGKTYEAYTGPGDQHLMFLTSDQIARFYASGGYLSVNQASDGSFIIRIHGQLRGGGLLKTMGGIVLGGVIGVGAVIGGIAIIASLPASSAAAAGAWTITKVGSVVIIQNGIGAGVLVTGGTVIGDAAIISGVGNVAIGSCAVIGASSIAGGILASDADTVPPTKTSPSGKETKHDHSSLSEETKSHEDETPSEPGEPEPIFERQPFD